ncbi:MAG: amino acid transporter [Chlamydiae bacterium RIFCSPHIGHO2_12_FULL_27_8]|nr:MAG: amino acid transporter [Chlamydiae bacterium RIFCSPHIGHO2_12_FULL_27_8]
MKKIFFGNFSIIIAIILGIVCGLFNNSFITEVANSISTVFLKILQLIGVPIVFLSLISNIGGMNDFNEMKTLGKKIFFYAILTTLIAASIALITFLIIDPTNSIETDNILSLDKNGSYLSFLIDAVPDNFFKAFVNNNIISVAILGMVFGLAILFLPKKNKDTLNHFFSSFFLLFLKVTKFIISIIPIGVFAFVLLFVQEFKQNSASLKDLMIYTICVVSANLIQGFIVLPIFLKIKKIPVIRTFKGMLPALMTAFFTKSSNAALPITIKCAEENLNVSHKNANVVHSLGSVINMNACAGFILITVLFVAKSMGATFSIFQMIMWIFLATLAAIGNAGVPMGCYFLTSAFLTSMNVPLYIMGLILPIYTILDMLESSLNVWSNSCVCVVIDKEIKEEILPEFE